MTDLRKAAQQALGYMKSIGQMDMYPEDWAIVGRLEAALAQQAEPRNQCGETCERARLCATCAQALAQQDEPLNLADPAVRKRLATQWGYVPAAQAEPVEQLAELQAMLRAEVDRLIAAGIQPQRKPLTEEEIVDAVREAEMESRKLERFAALVAAAERDACAALLEANGMRCGEESLSRLILETNAAAIRARSNT